ncbi:MAG: hypothetical protein IIX93_07315 [Clostridia bacterium]|nr:hypothetical protein [Clostridia bacterium]
MHRKPLNELTMIIAHPGRDTILKTREAAEKLNISIVGEACTLKGLSSLLSDTPADLLSIHILLPGLSAPIQACLPAFLRLPERPAVLYAAPDCAAENMTAGFSPILSACPSPEALLGAILSHYPPLPSNDEILRAEKVFACLGIPESRARQYLSRAAGLTLISSDSARRLSRDIYPEIAAFFGVSERHVSDAMRRAVDRAFLSGDIEKQYSLFQNTIEEARGKPTLSALLARVAEILRYGEDEKL